MINIRLIVDSAIRDIKLILKSHSASKKDLKLKRALYSGIGGSMFGELENLMMVTVKGIVLYNKAFFLDFGNSMENKEFEYLKGKSAITKTNNNVYLHIGKAIIQPNGDLNVFENFAKATIKKMLELGYQYNKEEGLIENKKIIKKSYLKKIIKECLYEQYSFKDENAPATKKQLWALYLATKKDYRNDNLTIKQASELLQNAQKDSNYQQKNKVNINKDLLKFLKNNAERAFKNMKSSLGQESIIKDDPMAHQSGKRYCFFGSGCGFAWLEYDKRNKVITKIVETANKLKDEFDKYILSKFFTTKDLEYYKSKGWPLQAMQAQDMNYNTVFWSIVKDYIESKKINSKCYVKTRLD